METINPFKKIKDVNELSPEEFKKIACGYKGYPNESASQVQFEPEKYYIFLLAYADNGGDEVSLRMVIGDAFKSFYGNAIVFASRDDAYNAAKKLIEEDIDGDIDVDESKVIVDGVPIKQAVSLYRFMKHCESLYPDDDFRIDQYFNEEDDEEDNRPPTTGNGFNTTYTKEV